MKRTFPRLAAMSGRLAGPLCLLLLTGCASGTPSGFGGSRASRDVQVQSSMVFDDDYEYFPAHEVYYSRNRQEYVYRTGRHWVRSTTPTIVPLDVLLASPSVRVDFRDSPERHHATVVSRYPRNWHREDTTTPDKHPKDTPR